MKITIDVHCTPQEARAFLGLPHLEPMQDALVAQMQERLSGYLEALEPEQLMKLWLPGGMQGLAQIQERFWSQLMGSMAGAGSEEEKPKSRKPKG
jgi:Tfp pilus assembly PilM family ATPase